MSSCRPSLCRLTLCSSLFYTEHIAAINCLHIHLSLAHQLSKPRQGRECVTLIGCLPSSPTSRHLGDVEPMWTFHSDFQDSPSHSHSTLQRLHQESHLNNFLLLHTATLKLLAPLRNEDTEFPRLVVICPKSLSEKVGELCLVPGWSDLLRAFWVIGK